METFLHERWFRRRTQRSQRIKGEASGALACLHLSTQIKQTRAQKVCISDEELVKVQKPKNFLPAIIIIILGTVVIGGVTTLHEHGFFVPWRNLGNPVQNDMVEKPNKILASTLRSIRVGTTKDRALELSFPWTGWEGTPEEFSLNWAEVPYVNRKS